MNLFVSQQYAAQIEGAEASLLREAATATARDAYLSELGGGCAAFAYPGSPLNKLCGVGFAGPLPEEALREVEANFAERGATLTVEVSTTADPDVARQLTERGYQLVGFEAVLGRPLAAQPDPQLPDGVTIHRCEPSDFEQWVDVIVTGFAAPDTQGVAQHESFPREAIEASVRGLARTRGFEQYLLTRGQQPRAAGSMRIAGPLAQLCGAATLPEFRRQGMQTALLDHRLAVAARAGCDVALVTVQPGSKSMQNAQRRGFGLLYKRAVLQQPAN